MITRIASVAIALGVSVGLMAGSRAVAETAFDDQTAQAAADGAAAAAEVAAQRAGPAPICQRGAVFQDMPPAALFTYGTALMMERIYLVQTRDAFAPIDQIMEDVAEGKPPVNATALILAEDMAALPEAAKDLPLLMVLSNLEPSGNPLMMLMLSPDAVLWSDIMAMLERRGMTDALRAFRLAQSVMPADAKEADDWTVIFEQSDTPAVQADRETARAGLDAAGRLYPTDSARNAGIDIIANNPEVAAILSAKVAPEDDTAAMIWLLDELRTRCASETYSADETERALGALGSSQAAILLLDELLWAVEDGTLEINFEHPYGALAPTTLRVLEIRGLTGEADALRTGMALLPAPYPREDWVRSVALENLTDDQRAQMQGLTEVMDPVILWAEMTKIAREARLIPGAAP